MPLTVNEFLTFILSELELFQNSKTQHWKLQNSADDMCGRLIKSIELQSLVVTQSRKMQNSCRQFVQRNY